MPHLTEQVAAIEEYLRILHYSEEAFRETLGSLSRSLNRADAGSDAFVESALRIDSERCQLIVIPPQGYSGILDVETAEKTASFRTALIVYTADEAIKALGEGVTGSDRISAGDMIAGFPVSELVRAVANSHRHSREWRALAARAAKGNAAALDDLRKNRNQPALKAILGTAQWATEPCGLALVVALSGAARSARVFDADRLLDRLRSVARDLCVVTFGSTESYDDALVMISDEEAYAAMDLRPIA